MTIDERVLENVRLAAGCGAGPSMLLSVALASLGATSIQEALAGLDRLREEILQIERDTPRPHRKLAELEPFLVARPPVARMRLEIAKMEPLVDGDGPRPDRGQGQDQHDAFHDRVGLKE